VRSRADETLGYLPREVARECAQVLDRIGNTATVECAARAYGRRDGSRSPSNSGSGLTFRIHRSLRLPSANWHMELAA
jgi:hypothetical protein